MRKLNSFLLRISARCRFCGARESVPRICHCGLRSEVQILSLISKIAPAPRPRSVTKLDIPPSCSLHSKNRSVRGIAITRRTPRWDRSRPGRNLYSILLSMDSIIGSERYSKIQTRSHGANLWPMARGRGGGPAPALWRPRLPNAKFRRDSFSSASRGVDNGQGQLMICLINVALRH